MTLAHVSPSSNMYFEIAMLVVLGVGVEFEVMQTGISLWRFFS